jgi:hypothetical protein
MAGFSIPIQPEQNSSGAVSFLERHIIEEATQTFVAWTPVQLNGTDGGVQAWDGTTVTAGIAGFASENASNLATTGVGAPQGFTPVLGPGSTIGSYAANANQPLAVITPSLVPINDGGISFVVAAPFMVFVGAVGTSGQAAIATTNAMRGTKAGLTIDTNGYWYVDTSKTNTVVIVDLDPRDAVGTVGGRVWFVVQTAAAQTLS